MEVKDRIKQVRENKGLSTYKLSEIMTNNGFKISQSTISKIENGNKKIDVDILQSIAKALDVTINDLMEFGELKKEVTSVKYIDLSNVPTNLLIKELNKRDDFLIKLEAI